MNVSDFKKGPEKLVSPSAPRSEQWLQKKKPQKTFSRSHSSFVLFLHDSFVFSVSPTGCSQRFEVGGALLDKGDVTYVAAPIRFKQLFNQSIVMFVVASRS